MEYIRFISDGIEAGVWPDAAAFPLPVILPCQTHSCRVGVIEADGVVPGLEDADAVVSFCPRLRIGVRTADCVPVLLYAPDIGAVAAVHAGWRGTLGGILTEVLDLLRGRGADMARLRAAFGPSICGDCYEVSEELAASFRDAGYPHCLTGERNVDLEKVNVSRLLAAGVKESNIGRSLACTNETPALPSWRRDKGTPVRLLTHIRLL